MMSLSPDRGEHVLALYPASAPTRSSVVRTGPDRGGGGFPEKPDVMGRGWTPPLVLVNCFVCV